MGRIGMTCNFIFKLFKFCIGIKKDIISKKWNNDKGLIAENMKKIKKCGKR